jgi:hypothetical protein
VTSSSHKCSHHPCNLCPNCINKCLIEQHKKKHAKELQDQKATLNTSMDDEMALRELHRKALEAKFKEQQAEQLRHNQEANHHKRLQDQKAKQRENDELLRIQREDEQERKRRAELERNRREQWKKELDAQLQLGKTRARDDAPGAVGLPIGQDRESLR